MRKTSKTSYKMLRHNYVLYIVPIIISALTISFMALFNNSNSNNVSALSYQSTSDMQFTFDPIVAMSISGDLSIDNLSPGSRSDSNIIDITAGTNSLGGYVLYATVGNSDNASQELRKDGTDTDHKFSSISTTTALADLHDNEWGYSYCIPNNNTNCTNESTDTAYWVSGDYDNTPATGYNGLPLYTSSTGVKLSEVNNQAGASNLKFKIGAKASSTQASGVYTNTINFIGITKILISDYTITYNDASGAGTNLPASQSGTGITTDTDVVLSSTIPTRTGYGFVGWCTVDNSADPTVCTNGTIYSAGDTYTVINAGGDIAIPLYAVWGLNTYNVTVNFAGSGVNSVTLANSTYGDTTINTSGTTAVLRHGVTYNISGTYTSGYQFSSWSATAGTLGSTTSASTTYVATSAATLTLTGRATITFDSAFASAGKSKYNGYYKMQDMSTSICNAVDTIGPDYAMNLIDTRDNEVYKVAKLKDNRCWMLDNLRLGSTSNIILSHSNTNITSAINSWTLPKSSTSCFYTSSCINGAGASGTGFTVPAVNVDYKNNAVTNFGPGSGKVGTYYNYCAITAGGVCSAINSSDASPDRDICPANWRLGTSSEYSSILSLYGGGENAAEALSLLYSGGFWNGVSVRRNERGNFWTLTRANDTNMLYLYFSSDGFWAGGGDTRVYGSSARCHAK